MAFDDVRFPDDISYGSVGGPGYRVDIVATDGEIETRLGRQSAPRRRYNVAYGVKTYAQLRSLMTFFIARKGAENGFRYKDFEDFTTGTNHSGAPAATDVVLGTGDGTTTTFQLKKYYVSGLSTRTRLLTHVLEETVRIALDGVEVDEADFSVDELTGIVTLNTAPTDEIVTGGCEFDVPVRFESSTSDWLQLSHDDFESGSMQSVGLVELLGETSAPEAFYYGGGSLVDPMTSNVTLSVGSVRVQAFAPNSSARRVTLPDPADMTLGGPHFVVFNLSGANTLDIYTPTGLLVAVPVGGASGGSAKILWVGLDGEGDNVWFYS